MRKIKALSPAKLNLTFEILKQLPNGYHQIQTLYQAVDLEDELTFEISEGSDIDVEVECINKISEEEFPCNQSNLIYKATKLFMSSLPVTTGIKLKASVQKKIPAKAGLASGSSNAAATLLVLNYYFKLPFTTDELLILAGRLGADIPFCLQGGTALGHGIGDNLTAVNCPSTMHYLLVKPKHIAIGTPWAYEAYDDYEGKKLTQNHKAAIASINNADIKTAAKNLGNSFEPIIFSHFPILSKLKETLLNSGSLACHLTGKGPTLYALASDLEAAHNLRQKLFGSKISTGQNKDELESWLVQSTPCGTRLISEF